MSKVEESFQVGELSKSPTRHEASKVVASHVTEKYAGTDFDRRDMSMLGKKQVLRRHFKFSTMLGFASTVMVAWEFILIVSPFSLANGGTPAVFWGLILSPLVLMPVYASLAEVASMSPTTAGQYHWVSEFAPPRFQKGLSYATGWLIAMGWQTFLCGVSFSTAGLILGLAKLNNPGYNLQGWHPTPLTIAIAISCTLFNVFLSVRLPLVEILVLVLHILGAFAIVIPLLATAPKGGVHETIFDFTASSGWEPVSLASTIGIIPSIGMLVGYDCSIHMSEETQDASKTIPNVIVWAVAGNAVLLLLVGISYIFCLGDVDSALNSETYQPVIQVFYNATQSKAGTSTMVAVIIVVFLSACIGQVATASRQLWSFARDRGVPFSRQLEIVPSSYGIPIPAIIVTCVITCLLSLINIGSYTAFNAFNSLGVVSILFSYTITIGCIIYRRIAGPPLPSRRWSLGKLGLPINIISLCFTIPMLFFYFWPLYSPVTPASMNWSSTMFGGILIISAVYYIFRGRHEYVGPVMLVKRDE